MNIKTSVLILGACAVIAAMFTVVKTVAVAKLVIGWVIGLCIACSILIWIKKHKK